ncbi:hypothetical protein Tco_0417095 [Tanacetum coccineum]
MSSMLRNQLPILSQLAEGDDGDFIPEVGRIEMTFFYQEIPFVKKNCLNVNRLVAKIKAFKSIIPFHLPLLWTKGHKILVMGQASRDLNKRFVGRHPMFISSLNISRLPDCEDSQFCHFIKSFTASDHLGIRYPNLID